MADRHGIGGPVDPARTPMSPDGTLEDGLRRLGADLVIPAGSGMEALVRARLVAAGRHGRPGRWRGWLAGGPRVGRVAVLAASLVLLVAAVAGAATLGLPGLRIVFGPVETPVAASGPAASPGATTPRPLGDGLGLGSTAPLEGLDAIAGFHVAIPTGPRLGAPARAWWDPTLGHGQIALVWASGAGVPPIDGSGIGAILTESPGRTDEGFVQKVLGPGSTLEPVTVGGAPGFWISGEPHEFLYLTPDGEVVQDSRRVVGDTLTWWVDGILYRFESGLGRDASIRVATSLG